MSRESCTTPARLPERSASTCTDQRADPVPAEVIRKLTARWEVPDLTEAHRVEWVTENPASVSLITI